MTPFSARTSPTGTFHFAAAAEASIMRAPAHRRDLQEPTASDGVHAAPPSFFAASLIATRTRPYVPQRQMLPFIALSICASVGFGVAVSNAVAAMTCPDWQ